MTTPLFAGHGQGPLKRHRQSRRRHPRLHRRSDPLQELYAVRTKPRSQRSVCQLLDRRRLAGARRSCMQTLPRGGESLSERLDRPDASKGVSVRKACRARDLSDIKGGLAHEGDVYSEHRGVRVAGPLALLGQLSLICSSRTTRTRITAGHLSWYATRLSTPSAARGRRHARGRGRRHRERSCDRTAFG